MEENEKVVGKQLHCFAYMDKGGVCSFLYETGKKWGWQT